MWGGGRHWARAAALMSGRRWACPDLMPPVPKDCTMAAFAAGVLRFMDGQGVPRALLVGNSMGGRIAVEMALSAPERVEGLVLVSPAGLTPPPTWLKALPKFRMPYEDGPENIEPGAFRDLALAQMFGRPLDDPRTAPLAAAEREAHRGISFAQFLTGSARCLTEMARSVPAEDALRLLPVKGLIWGVNDRLIPVSVSADLQGLWPSARLEVIEDAGHVPHLERPEAFVEALRICEEVLK